MDGQSCDCADTQLHGDTFSLWCCHSDVFSVAIPVTHSPVNLAFSDKISLYNQLYLFVYHWLVRFANTELWRPWAAASSRGRTGGRSQRGGNAVGEMTSRLRHIHVESYCISHGHELCWILVQQKHFQMNLRWLRCSYPFFATEICCVLYEHYELLALAWFLFLSPPPLLIFLGCFLCSQHRQLVLRGQRTMQTVWAWYNSPNQSEWVEEKVTVRWSWCCFEEVFWLGLNGVQ